MKVLWWSLIETLRFLTLLPAPSTQSTIEPGTIHMFGLFPLVGALIGAFLVGLGVLTGEIWGVAVRPVLLVVVWGIVTGGLHLDGLADTFDAVMSWRPRERKLEIMRDSRIGTMGLLAVIAVLALKAAWVSAAGAGWSAAVWVAPVLGRWAMVYALRGFPPARASGLGHSAQAQIRPNELLLATVTAVLLAFVLAGARGVIAVALVWAVTYLLSHWWTRSLGGLTGDTYGALCEISEVIALAVISAHLL